MRSRFMAMGVSAAVVAATAGILVAGPLTPPAGPVASTYKTLAEVEPRIPVSTATTPGTQAALYRITQPGSYYLTGNIQASQGKAGIQILADDVTLDLNGFSIVGNQVGTTGIVAVTNAARLEVRNGSVTGWTGHAVDLTLVDASAVRDIRASGSLRGILVGSRSLVDTCFAIGNTHEGISVLNETRVRDCTAKGNYDGVVAGNSARVEGCVSAENRGSGIVTYNLAVVDRCIVSGNLDNGVEASPGTEVKGCTAQDNRGDGIQFSGFCTIVDNVATTNSFAGFRSLTNASRSVIRGNNSMNNATGILVEGASNLILGNTCTINTSNFKIVAGNRVATIVTLATSGAIDGNAGGTNVSTPDANFAY